MTAEESENFQQQFTMALHIRDIQERIGAQVQIGHVFLGRILMETLDTLQIHQPLQTTDGIQMPLRS
jgi:hypothetical protein